ncbi:MAG: DUF3810 domain-containing protein [Oscillospiraceae bacterium]|nr:DUF3810 domain-containing protein [Oscillospiraceae bacterium]
MTKKCSLKISIALTLAALFWGAAGFVVFRWLKARPEVITESFRPFSRNVLRAMARFWSFVPFSAAEILLYAAIVIAVVWVIRLIWVLISGSRPRIKFLFRFVSVLLLVAVFAVEAYYGLWGMNYFGQTLGSELGLNVQKRSSAELAELSEYLVRKTNALAREVKRNEDGTFSSDYTFEGFAEAVSCEFSEYSGEEEPPVKYVIASRGLSHFRTTGIFVAYTGEANVNADNYISSLPFCMAHETAHRYAVAREDEANFMAFLVLNDAEDPALRYSVYLAALRYTQSQLASADKDAYLAVASEYNELVRFDNAKYSEYWSQFEGKAAEVSQKTNNAYLSANGAPDGVKSYGRMVDLLLAWYELQ